MTGILASADLIIWIVIAIVVALSKAFSKFQENAAKEKETAPPPPRPRPRSQRASKAPPVSRQAPRVPPPVEPRGESWTPPASLEEFLNQLPQAQPVKKTPPPPPPPALPPPRAQAEPPAKKPEPKPAPTKPRLSKSRQWALALQDRENIRNAIMAAEILGPAGGLSERQR
jgi:hypothetical protein